ncbi:unnamed protein product [Heterosigma akashiwo]
MLAPYYPAWVWPFSCGGGCCIYGPTISTSSAWPSELAQRPTGPTANQGRSTCTGPSSFSRCTA